jgi:hypothetical protein
VHQRQYPIPLEALRVIVPHIQHLWDQGILREVQSAWNTLYSLSKSQGPMIIDQFKTCAR